MEAIKKGCMGTRVVEDITYNLAIQRAHGFGRYNGFNNGCLGFGGMELKI